MNYTLHSGSYESQGPRPTMEDTHLHIDNIKNMEEFEHLLNFDKIAYYAVFDGHGGDQTAKMVQYALHPHILLSEEFRKNDIPGALVKGFQAMDRALEIENEEDMMHGSTCVCCLVLDDSLHVGNIGDSEGILISVTNNIPTPTILTKPHKASDPTEKGRIQSEGGNVFGGRICGILTVSRSFGDFFFKTQKCNFVSCVPDVQAVTLQSQHRYVVLACDGLWDVITHQDVAQLVHQSFAKGKTPDEVAEILVNRALQCQTQDNVTVVVVKIEWHSGNSGVPESDNVPDPVKNKSSHTKWEISLFAPRGSLYSGTGKERLESELRDIPKNGGWFTLTHDSPFDIKCTVVPPGGFWKGGSFLFQITPSEFYPEEPPKLYCETPILHPHVDAFGNVHLLAIYGAEGWHNQKNLHDVIFGLALMFAEPKAEDPLNIEVAEVLKRSEIEFAEMVGRVLHREMWEKVNYRK